MLLTGIVAMAAAAPSGAGSGVTLGGGADAVAGVVHAPGAWTGEGAAGVEGDLTWREGAFEAVVALDVGVSLVPLFAYELVPEQLTLGGDAGPVWLQGGIAPAPWRVEAVDGWDNALVTWSVEDRAALPGSLLALEVGLGSRDRGVSFLGGLDLGGGLNLFGDVGGAFVAAPLVAGVQGRIVEDNVTVAGGVFAWPDRPAVAAQVGGTFAFEGWTLIGQATAGWNAPFGAHVEVDFLPEGVVTPVVRGELLGAQLGGAVGVRVKPTDWLFLKAEMAYADAAPQAWVEVAVFGETKVKRRKKR
jgi:hypothetical protein